MFLLSRRSAVFALFVILAFATSTLLALLTKNQQVEAIKLCLNYGDMTTTHQCDVKMGKGKFKETHLSSKTSIRKEIEFGLRIVDGVQRCVVWNVEHPKSVFVAGHSEVVNSSNKRVMVELTAPLYSRGRVNYNRNMVVKFRFNRACSSLKLDSLHIRTSHSSVFTKKVYKVPRPQDGDRAHMYMSCT
eukprot:GHVS01098628.1.p1 GENE.GHVS01098628.1~~GHVS01098628.1.p1  ORF type:complete len:208 (-),score=14.45 GHVS01098628.1:69-632(-)